MTTSTLTRLDALELHFGEGDCPVCKGWTDIRIMTTDPETGEQTGETRPAACPACGRTPSGTLELAGFDIADLP